MSTVTHRAPDTAATVPSDRAAQAVCAASAVLTVPVFALTDLGAGDTGAAVTDVLVGDATALTAGTLLAILVSSGLLLASVRLGRSVGGDTGRLMTLAGGGVAVLYAVYYGVFGAGAVVASQMLSAPGAGLGEASLLLLNMAEMARVAPGLALVGAAVVARRVLPRGLWMTAAVLLVLVFVPFTTWVSALLTPLWLAVAGSRAAGSADAALQTS